MNWLLLERQSFQAKFSSLKSIAAPRTEMRGKPCQAQNSLRDIWPRSLSIDGTNLGSSFVNVLQTVTSVLFIWRPRLKVLEICVGTQ